MKNRIIFIVIFIIILFSVIGLMVFLARENSSIIPVSSHLERGWEQLPTTTTQPIQLPQEVSQYAKYITLDTDSFVLTLPSGWKMTSQYSALPIILTDSKEEVLNEKAKEIDFQTNLSINRAEWGQNYFKDYVEAVKASLISNIPIIKITKEEEVTLNDKEAYFMEIESVQDNLGFSTFVALVVGKENTVWAFSFNTLEESWLKYKEVFYKIIESLKMK